MHMIQWPIIHQKSSTKNLLSHNLSNSSIKNLISHNSPKYSITNSSWHNLLNYYIINLLRHNLSNFATNLLSHDSTLTQFFYSSLFPQNAATLKQLFIFSKALRFQPFLYEYFVVLLETTIIACISDISTLNNILSCLWSHFENSRKITPTKTSSPNLHMLFFRIEWNILGLPLIEQWL